MLRMAADENLDNDILRSSPISEQHPFQGTYHIGFGKVSSNTHPVFFHKQR